MTGLKHFIWDFDGTLFDTYPLIVNSLALALEDFGYTAPKREIMELMLNTIPHAINYYSERYNLGENLREKYRKHMEKEAEFTSSPFEFAEDVLEKIIETGRYNYIFTHRNESTFSFLDKFSLSKYFREIVTPKNGFALKPSPEAVLYLVNKYEMQKTEAVMIGDRELDLLSGKNAGILTCHFVNEFIPQDLECDFRIHSLKDIFEVL